METEEGYKSFLVPGVDLFNHKRNAKTDFFIDDEENEFVITSGEASYKPGQQIFRDYSPNCPNLELLRIWGFVDPDVPFEVAALNLELDPKEKFLDVKLQWLKDSGVLTGEYVHYPYSDWFVYSDGVPDRIAAFLRIKHFKVTNRERYNPALLPNPFKRMNDDIERAVQQELQKTIDDTLRRFPTTLKQDERLLEQSENLSEKQYAAILVRMEEKFALTNALKSLTKKKIHLSPDSPEASIPKYKGEQRTVLNKKRKSSEKEISQK